MQFGGANQIRAAQLRDKVEIMQASATANSGQGTEFRGDELDLNVRAGRFLQTANSVGPAEIVLANAADGKSKPSPGKTVIDSSRFDAQFSRDNRISILKGSSPVKIVSSNPGNPDRVSTSDDLLATFTGDKNLSLQDVIQTGNVQIQDGQRTALGDRATFNQVKNTLTLTGNVRFKDPETGAYLTAKSLALDRQSGETVAIGDVKTSYSELKTSHSEQKNQPSGAILATSQTIHVTAPQMVASNSTGTARYSGGSRLWQGGNIIQAPTIDLARNQRILDASGQGKNRVSTVFVQNGGQNRRQTPVEVTADHLHYDDNQRKATFDGAIVVHSSDSTLHADHAIILLKPQAQRAAAASGTPSEVETITATGNILIQQPARKATGTRLLYTADEQKVVLTGSAAAPPSIFDAEHGHVTGVSLTFYTHDDTVLVDSSNSATISTPRVKK
jgi:lipopolysaccharide export system protein LptA